MKGVEPYSTPVSRTPWSCITVPAGTRVVFSQTCGEDAIRLADRLWTNLMR